MTSKKIFLSHIHEEKELALLIKDNIVEAFAGFVEVFVSTDGVSIPAGSNFLKRIEGGLIDCVGALYLISPKSVSRNWINFELGAVWTRNLLSLKNDGPEVPTIPICHSGITPSQLPPPINNLNAINAAEPGGWAGVFNSLQAAVGSKGRLKIDVNTLVEEIAQIEYSYTIEKNLIRALEIIGLINSSQNKSQLASAIKKQLEKAGVNPQYIEFGQHMVHSYLEPELSELARSSLKDVLILENRGCGMGAGPMGAIAGPNFDVTVRASELSLTLGI